MPYRRDQNTRQSFHEKLRTPSETEATLSTIKRQGEEQSTQIKAQKLGIPYINLKFIPVNPEALKTLTKEQALKAQMAVFQRSGMNLKVALADIANPLTRRILQSFYQEGYQIELFLVSRQSLTKAFNTYGFIKERGQIVKDVLVIPESFIKSVEKNTQSLGDFSNELTNIATSEFIQKICAGAVATLASDIHIEPKGNTVRLRYRIDGVLQDILNFDVDLYNPLISRVKTLSSLILNIKTTAQDGRFSIVITDEDGTSKQSIDVRVSILPGKNGEIIVLRLLNTQVQSLDIHSFGIRPAFLETIIRNLERPQGMIMLSGPTGSGKTTSLYTFLSYINNSDSNIITIEDPIEYRLKNINQTQVDLKRGYTFANGLRAIVRQDPDVIMVGEIRDAETATIAVNASITGHLVFSTIHTNDSVGIITRLQELNIDPNLITSSMNLFVAQRLLRKLCTTCREPYKPSSEEITKIEHALAVISPRSGVTIPKQVSSLYRAKGCPECYGLGYKGRFAIYELFEARDEIKELVLKKAPEFQVFRKAMELGMITLFQDGVLHALEGETSLEEVDMVAGDTTYIEELYEATLSSALSRGIYLKTYTPDSIHPELINTISDALSIDTQLEIISSLAIKSRATDIHIEPDMNHLVIRYRIDGVLQEIARLPKSLYPQILSQIKILTGAKLDITNKIQEGRFTIFGDKQYDIRVSIVPGGYGQTIVLRILKSDISTITLSDLGMDEYNRSLLETELKQTSGLILVTGPTSAGKSTTLYAALNTLNQPGVKIITIEDPIEYKLPGILQTSVSEENGYTFPNALKALLRQNPNIILIGEIRDIETAKVAMQAAATGHLLLSTLHTNDAASAVLRLYDLGIGLTEIATFVNATVAQRIIRKLDPDTKQSRVLTESEKKTLKSILPSPLHSRIPDQVYEATPTDMNPTGYHEMTAIFEVFVLSDTIKKAIPTTTNIASLKQIAIEEGMMTLEVSGIMKVLEGITDFQEIERVLGINILAS